MDNQQDRFADEANRINDSLSGEREYPSEIKTPSGTSNVLRLIDGSGSFRKYWISWFICDDDRIRPFIVKNGTTGESVLSRMLGDSDNFYRGGYLDSKKGQFGKVYIYQQRDPELFKRTTEYWNPSYNGTGSCRPKLEYVFNALHRNPETAEGRTFNWCSENKHTKLIRFGQKAIKALKVVRDNCGEFSSYDIIFSKQGQGSETFFSVMKGDIGTQHNVVGPASETESSYERYDLDYITSLSSANYVLKNLRNQLDRIGAVMGYNFVAELEQQQGIEQEAYEKAKGIQVDQKVPPIVTAAQSYPANQPPVRQAVVRTPVNAAVASANMIECGHCHGKIPDGAVICPLCNGVLLSDCDICHKPFSVFANSCPACGQIYKTA